MTKPLKARSTRFEKIQISTSAILGANPASSASRHPIRGPFLSAPRGEPVHGYDSGSGVHLTRLG
jgi:hypothetical protein